MRRRLLRLGLVLGSLVIDGKAQSPPNAAPAAGSLATSAFVATHFAAAAATVGWAGAEWLASGRPSVLGAIGYG